MRCTVDGLTPNRSAMTRMPGRPGVARASRIRFSSAGAIGGGPNRFPRSGPSQALGSLRAVKPRSHQRISLTSIVLDAARINSKHKPILPDLNHAVADVAVRIMKLLTRPLQPGNNTTTATEKARTPPSAPLTP